MQIAIRYPFWFACNVTSKLGSSLEDRADKRRQGSTYRWRQRRRLATTLSARGQLTTKMCSYPWPHIFVVFFISLQNECVKIKTDKKYAKYLGKRRFGMFSPS